MSRRFGRTQKRKLMERVANLEEAYNRELSLLNYTASERDIIKDKYNELSREIKRWWDYSVLLDPKVESVSEFPPQFRIAYYEQLSPEWFQEDIRTSIDFHYQTLEALRVAGQKDLGSMAYHIMLRGPHGERRLYIDSRTFEQFKGIPSKIKKYICDRIIWEVEQEYR
jgi:hypothetical protein